MQDNKRRGVQAKKRVEKTYCAAGSRNAVNYNNKSGMPGKAMHYFPSDESLRQKWIRFVQIHRKDFVATKSSALCSAHFDDSCFRTKGIPLSDGIGKANIPKRYLIRGSTEVIIMRVDRPTQLLSPCNSH